VAGIVAGGGLAVIAGLVVAAVVVRNRRKNQSTNSVSLTPVSDPVPVTKPPSSKFVVGSRVKALYTDGQWYDGTVKQVSNGQYLVSYTGYNEDAWLPEANIRSS